MKHNLEYTDCRLGRLVFEWDGQSWNFVKLIPWDQLSEKPDPNTYYKPFLPFRNPNNYQMDDD